MLAAMRLPSGHYQVSSTDFRDLLKHHEIPESLVLTDEEMAKGFTVMSTAIALRC